MKNFYLSLLVFVLFFGYTCCTSCVSGENSSDEIKWFNADHAPTGAWSSFVFGKKDKGGGFMLTKSTPAIRNVYIAYKSNTSGVRILPFFRNTGDFTNSYFYNDSEVSRDFRLCSDKWVTPHFSLTVYSPVWNIPDPQNLTISQKQLIFCPVQWIEISWDNSQNSNSAEILFGLQSKALSKISTEVNGAQLEGVHFNPYALEKGYIISLTTSNDYEVVAERYANILKYFTYDDNTSGIESGGLIIKIPPGSKDSLLLLTVHYTDGNITSGVSSTFYYRDLFDDYVETVEYAYQVANTVKRYSLNMDQKLLNSGLNPYRQFLVAHSTHTYLANSGYLQSEIGDLWVISEGDFHYLNTLDLTADMVFYELRMHPWTVRNVLNTTSSRYSYYDEVRDPNDRHNSYPGGISFCHDIGRYTNFTEPGISDYEGPVFMTHEELVNWILCAALYWKYTDDNSWLGQQSTIFKDCLQSLINRDHYNENMRDGVASLMTTYLNTPAEISTYDALDPALKQPYENLYLAVKTWASYIALDHIFQHLNMNSAADTARIQADRAAKTIKSYNQEEGSGSWIKPIFGGKSNARIIPAVEGLIFPFKMGDIDAVSETGRFDSLITTLKSHLETVLTPGICLDPITGAWKLSSDTTRTWQSKVYLCQYIAENILGITGEFINGEVDNVHTQMQLNSTTAKNCWSEQIFSDNLTATIGFHYPRGVTSTLWWEHVDLSNPEAEKLTLIPEPDTLQRYVPNLINIEAQNASSNQWAYLTFTNVRLTSNSASLQFSVDTSSWGSEITIPLNMGAGSFYIKDTVAEFVTILMEDIDGDLGIHSQQLTIDPENIPAGVKNFSGAADQIYLSQNYPNPFNSSTMIHYQLPLSAEVELKIYNLQGKLIKKLEQGQKNAGYYKIVWNGYDEQGYKVSSGTYFYELKVSDKILRNRMTFIK